MRIASILFTLVTWSHSCFLQAQWLFLTCVLATVSPSLCHNDTTDPPLLLYNSHTISILSFPYVMIIFSQNFGQHISHYPNLPLIKFSQRNASFHPRKVMRQRGPRIWWGPRARRRGCSKNPCSTIKRSTTARSIFFRSRNLGTSPSTWSSIWREDRIMAPAH